MSNDELMATPMSRLLQQGLREAEEARRLQREADNDAAAEDFAPEKIRYALEHWGELEVAAEGGVGSLARGSGKGDRLGIAVLLADLERAADQLPADWLPTLRVFRAQGRLKVWTKRWEGRVPTQLDDTRTVDDCLWRMARFLGWTE